MKKFLSLIILTLLLSSCTVQDVHTLRSPCVANDSDDIYNSPCVRRPANANWLS